MNNNVNKVLKKINKGNKSNYYDNAIAKLNKKSKSSSSSYNYNYNYKEAKPEMSKKKKALFFSLGAIGVLAVALSISLPLSFSYFGFGSNSNSSLVPTVVTPIDQAAVDAFNAKTLPEKMNLYNSYVSSSFQQQVWDNWFKSDTIDPASSEFNKFLQSVSDKNTSYDLNFFTNEFAKYALKDCYINNPSRKTFSSAFLRFQKPTEVLNISDPTVTLPKSGYYGIYSYDTDNITNISVKKSTNETLYLQVDFNNVQSTFFSYITVSPSSNFFFYYNQSSILSDDVLSTSNNLFSNLLRQLTNS